MKSSLCVICGRAAGEHHGFMPPVKPADCVCEEESWGDRILPICAGFVAETMEPMICANCEHDEKCHTQGKSAEDVK